MIPLEEHEIEWFLEGLVFTLYNVVAVQAEHFTTYAQVLDCAHKIEFQRTAESASLRKLKRGGEFKGQGKSSSGRSKIPTSMQPLQVVPKIAMHVSGSSIKHREEL